MSIWKSLKKTEYSMFGIFMYCSPAINQSVYLCKLYECESYEQCHVNVVFCKVNKVRSTIKLLDYHALFLCL